MYKKLKIKLYISFFILITIFSSLTVNGQASIASDKNANKDAADSVHLVIDNLNYEKLPSHFRTTSNISILENKNLNTKGLKDLNISGSQQFSKLNIDIVKKSINTTLPIIDIDLRQESHGFANGLPISWANYHDNSNKGLSRDEVLLKEKKDLQSIKLNKPLTFYNHPEITINPTNVENESKLAKDNSLGYIRVTVTDGALPTPDMVDFFIKNVLSSPKNSWFHFHCKEGIGRTTTFMIMYDMMRNYKYATAEEIIDRQISLVTFTEKNIEGLHSDKRLTFFNKFYEYCKENGDDFKTTYSEYLKKTANSHMENHVAILI